MSAENSKTMGSRRKPSAEMILFISLLATVGGALCFMKAPPVLNYIMDFFGITSEAQAGWLISIFGVSAIFLSLPAGLIVTRFGMFTTGVFSLITLLVGSIMGATATGYNTLLLSRLIEGIGFIFLGTIGPAAVGAACSDKNRGLYMGILMNFMAFAQIIMLNLAPRIAGASRWQNVWWTTAILSAFTLVLWLFIMRTIDEKDANAPVGEEVVPRNVLREVMRNWYVWLVAFTWMFYLIPEQGVYNFLTRYLSEIRGLEVAKAASMVSVASIVGIFVGPITGIVADKVGSRKYPMGFLMLAGAAVYAAMPIFPTSSFLLIIVLFGIAVMGMPGLVFAAVTEVIDSPEHANMAVATVNLMQSFGSFLSAVVFGYFVDGFGWTMAFYAIIPIAVAGAVTSFINKRLP